MEGLQRIWMISIVFLLSLMITEGLGSHPLIAREQLHEGDFTNKLSFIQEDTNSPGRLLGLIDNQLVEILSHTIKTIASIGSFEQQTLSKPSSFIKQGSGIITTHPKSQCLCEFSIDQFSDSPSVLRYSGRCNLYSLNTEIQYGKQWLSDALYTYPYHITSINNQPMELYVTDGRVIKKIDQESRTINIVYEDSDPSHIFYRLMSSGGRIFASTSRGIRLLTLNFQRSEFLAFTTHSDYIMGGQDRPNNNASRCDFSRMIDGHFTTSGSEGAGPSPFPINNLVPITPSLLLAIRCDDKYLNSTGCKEPKLTLIDVYAGLMTDACCKHPEMFHYCDMMFMPGYVTILNHTLYITNEMQQTLEGSPPLLDSFKLRDYCKVCGDVRNYPIETVLQSESDAQPCYKCTLNTHNLNVGWEHCEPDINYKISVSNTNHSCLERFTSTSAPTTTTNIETVTQTPTTVSSETGTIHEATSTETSTITTTETSTGTVIKTNTTAAISTPRHTSNITINPDLHNGQNHNVLYICIGVVIAGTLGAVSLAFLVRKIIKHYKSQNEESDKTMLHQTSSHCSRRLDPLPATPARDNQIYNFIGDEFYEVLSDPDYISTNNISRVSQLAGPIPEDIELQEVYNTSVSDHTQRSNSGAYVDDQTYAIDVVSAGTD